MSSSILALPKLIVAGVALVAAGSVVWHTARAPLLVELAQQDSAHTREKLRIVERAAEVLKDAQDRGDALTNTLAQRQTEIDQLSREKRNAVAKVTSGRACLTGPALRLLSTAPGLSVSGIAPAPGSAAAAGEAAAPNTDNAADNIADIANGTGIVSTDADIAGWAIDAGAQYETCRDRLDALIDWHLKPPAATSPAETAHDH